MNLLVQISILAVSAILLVQAGRLPSSGEKTVHDKVKQNDPQHRWYDLCGVNKNGTIGGTSNYIIGGQQAFPGDFPWMGAVLHNNVDVCGAVLIDNYHVLTAAHCLKCNGTIPNCTLDGIHEIQLGTHDLIMIGPNARRAYVSNATLHPNYTGPQSRDNDLAILRLQQNMATEILNNEDIYPICAPEEGFNFDGMDCYMSGWGQTQWPVGSKSQFLMYIEVTAMNSSTCCPHYCDICNTTDPTCDIHDYNLCAGGAGKEACGGDSGGPMSCEVDGAYQLAGINNWGNRCGLGDLPGVYINVASFLAWIDTFVSAV